MYFSASSNHFLLQFTKKSSFRHLDRQLLFLLLQYRNILTDVAWLAYLLAATYPSALRQTRAHKLYVPTWYTPQHTVFSYPFAQNVEQEK